MKPRFRRQLAAALLIVSMALLVPGVLLPALTIRGTLTREGIAHTAPLMLERGLNDETIAVLQSMMNPAVLAFIGATGGDLRTTIIERVGPQITASLQANAGEIEVYTETRSIAGAVRRLYEVGSPLPATLILLFSVIVPLGKAGLAAWAVFAAGPVGRRRTLRMVEIIAKWSMADVFVVALFIAYLAAQASTAAATGPDAPPPLVAFAASFGPGFYWFAAYCVFSLAAHQAIARVGEPGGEAVAAD